MPRRRKAQTRGGSPSQPPSAAPRQVYGEGEEQLRQQQQIPLPDRRGIMGAQGNAQRRPNRQGADIARQAGRAPAQQAPPQGDPMEVARMLPSPGNGLLKQPSMRPNEPVTAGMPRGPGRNALSAQPPNRPKRLLQELYRDTGDPGLHQMIQMMER